LNLTARARTAVSRLCARQAFLQLDWVLTFASPLSALQAYSLAAPVQTSASRLYAVERHWHAFPALCWNCLILQSTSRQGGLAFDSLRDGRRHYSLCALPGGYLPKKHPTYRYQLASPIVRLRNLIGSSLWLCLLLLRRTGDQARMIDDILGASTMPQATCSLKSSDETMATQSL